MNKPDSLLSVVGLSGLEESIHGWIHQNTKGLFIFSPLIKIYQSSTRRSSILLTASYPWLLKTQMIHLQRIYLKKFHNWVLSKLTQLWGNLNLNCPKSKFLTPKSKSKVNFQFISNFPSFFQFHISFITIML